MVVVPLVIASLFVGVASLGDVRRLGRIGGKTLGVFRRHHGRRRDHRHRGGRCRRASGRGSIRRCRDVDAGRFDVGRTSASAGVASAPTLAADARRA